MDAEDTVFVAEIIAAVLISSFVLAKALYWLESRSIKREAADGQAQLERYLAEQHANR